MAFPGDVNLGGIGMTTLRMVARATEEQALATRSLTPRRKREILMAGYQPPRSTAAWLLQIPWHALCFFCGRFPGGLRASTCSVAQQTACRPDQAGMRLARSRGERRRNLVERMQIAAITNGSRRG